MDLEKLKMTDPKMTLAADYKKIDAMLAGKKLAQEKLSLMMGHGKSWYSTRKSADARLAIKQIEQISLILGCSPDGLVILPEQTEQESREHIADMEPSQFEIDVTEALKDIKAQLSTQKEILMYLFNEKQQEENKELCEEKDELEIACKTLKTMIENRQAIKKADYMQTAKAAGVSNEQIADAAIAKCSFKKKTTGYGANKTTWIYKTVEI